MNEKDALAFLEQVRACPNCQSCSGLANSIIELIEFAQRKDA